jgi:hypothetical protein
VPRPDEVVNKGTYSIAQYSPAQQTQLGVNANGQAISLQQLLKGVPKGAQFDRRTGVSYAIL